MAFDPDKYLAEKGAVAQGAMRINTPAVEQAPAFDPDKYLAEKSGQEEPTMLRKGLGYAGQALDYPGGLIRTGLASVAGQVSGNPNTVTQDDVVNAFKGKAPSSADYLGRLGVSEGPSMDLPHGEFDVPYLGKVKTPEKVSLRDAEGFALDVATDPLTAVSRANKALRPIGAAAEATGEKMYKSGLKKVDEKLLEQGTKPVSDVLLDAGKSGSTKQLQKAAREMGEGLSTERESLYKQATDKGVTVDMAYPLPNAEGVLADLRSDPGLAPMADELSKTMDRYKAGGKVDVGTLSDWKSNLYNALPQSAYDANGRLSAPAKKFQKALASDFKTAIVDAGNTAEKGLGDKINSINDKWSTLIQADKPLTMQARRGNTTNAFTSVDGMLGAGALAASHDPFTAAAIMAAKKGSDISKTTAARTIGGKGLVDLGSSGLLDATARQQLAIERDRKKKGLVSPQPGLMSGEE